jgi:hypothetical protein
VHRRRTLALRLAVVVASVWLGWTATASAADVVVERSEDAEPCPGPSAFRDRVLDDDRGSSRTVRVRFERSEHGFIATVQTTEGRRRLEDPSCDALAEATLVVVRLALDEVSSTPAEERSSADAGPTPPPQVPAAARRSSRVEVLAGGAAALGLGVPFAPGVRIAAGVAFADARLSAGLTGIYLPATTRSLPPGEVAIELLGGGAEACGRATTSSQSLGVALCARAELSRLQGTARGYGRNKERGRPLPTAGLVLRGVGRVLGPIGIFAEAAAVVPLARERFHIEGAGVVYDPPAVAATGAVGASVDFE